MNDKQRRRFERLLRSRDVAATHSADFPANSVGGKALASISGKIAEIETLDAARSTADRHAQQGTSTRRDKRDALQKLLTAMSETAATMALDFPEYKDRYRRSFTNRNDQNLLTTARSFYTEATLDKARFIEYNMPADFLETLAALIADFEGAAQQQNVGKGGRRANSVAVDAALDAGEKDLERLNTALRNRFADDPATLAAWESARRLQSAPKKPKKPDTPPAPQK